MTNTPKPNHNNGSTCTGSINTWCQDCRKPQGKPNLREELHQFAIAYRPESKETREEDIDQIMQKFTQALEGEIAHSDIKSNDPQAIRKHLIVFYKKSGHAPQSSSLDEVENQLTQALEGSISYKKGYFAAEKKYAADKDKTNRIILNAQLETRKHEVKTLKRLLGKWGTFSLESGDIVVRVEHIEHALKTAESRLAELRQSEEQITGGCGGRGHPGPSGQGIGDYESERSE